MKRTRRQIREAFDIQQLMLHQSCAAYDTGLRFEGLRIATTVCTLVHDGGKNIHSLLSMMGLKDKMMFSSSFPKMSPEDVKKFTMLTPLIALHRFPDNHHEFVPLSHRRFLQGKKTMPVRYASFQERWNEDIIFKNEDAMLTSRQISLALRNTEGGSHYDED
jgi:hypothetical protein